MARARAGDGDDPSQDRADEREKDDGLVHSDLDFIPT
jgi:hypothetical protein